MVTTYAVDFETYYDKDYTVKSLGPVAYALHERFDAYLVSIAGSDGFEWVGHPSKAPWDRIDGHTWVSHNAAFDQAVFLRLRSDGIVSDELSPGDWFCSADLMAYLQYPRSLANAVAELYGVKLDKSVRSNASGLEGNELFENSAMLEYAMDDARYCLKLWTDYSAQWPEQERDLSHHTRCWGAAGVTVDIDRLNADISNLTRLRWDAEQLLPWTSDGETVVLSLPKLAEACRDAGIEPPPSLAITSEECDAWLDRHGETYPWVGAMRQWRRTNMLLTKYEAIKRRVSNGKMPYGLKYCGAQHTGRWSGDSGVNMQNLPRGELFGATMRHVFIPAPGHKFIVADFSQIEPRVLAWLAEDAKLLDEIAKHHDFYEAQAVAMGLWNSDKPLQSDPDLRHKVKGLNLGLGYGMGWMRFRDITGLPIDEAKRLVALYKEKNGAVIRMWNELDRLANLAAQSNDRTMNLELPSGRVIRYFNIKRSKGLTAEVIKGGRRTYIWGGFLTENMTQAVAREVFAAALLRVNRIEDCRILWHVHDEIICEVPDALAEVKQTEIETAMCAVPEWADGLPVAVKSSIEERYAK